jgi:hypothetical protein
MIILTNNDNNNDKKDFWFENKIFYDIKFNKTSQNYKIKTVEK